MLLNVSKSTPLLARTFDTSYSKSVELEASKTLIVTSNALPCVLNNLIVLIILVVASGEVYILTSLPDASTTA
jgi:hypothetical protein